MPEKASRVIQRGPRRPADGRPVPGLLDLSVPWQVLAGTSESPGHLGRIGPVTAAQARQLAGCAAPDAAAGGCAHTLASPGYRPPPRLRDYITARDRTCRNPRCRQPAWRGDLDHTIPFDDGGLTCSCNLGAFCRTDHLLKHHPGWKVRQTAPGTFTTTPDTYPA